MNGNKTKWPTFPDNSQILQEVCNYGKKATSVVYKVSAVPC